MTSLAMGVLRLCIRAHAPAADCGSPDNLIGDIDLSGIEGLTTVGITRRHLAEGARRAFVSRVDRNRYAELGRKLLGSREAGDALYAVMSAEVAGAAASIAPALALARAQELELILLTDSRWDVYVTKEVQGVTALVTATRVSRLRRPRVRFTSTRTAHPVTVEVSPHVVGETSNARVVYVSKNGLSYAGLYKLDQWLERDLESPLHENNVAFLTYGESSTPGRFQPLRPISKGFYMRKLPRVLFWTYWILRRTAPALRWRTAKISLAALHVGKQFATDFPGAELLILTYESLTPPQVLVAGRASSATMVATHERPNTAWQDQFAKVADVLVVANEKVRDELLASPSCSVGGIEVLGLWKTDFLVDEATGRRHVRQDNPPIVVALANHVSLGPLSGLASLELGPEALAGFIEFVTSLAQQFPNVRFVIRGKNTDWLFDPACSVAQRLVASTQNVEVDEDKTTNARTYELCAAATLVVAQYTSLVDECIAAGIPVAVYDMGPTWQDITESAQSHLPPELFIRELNQVTALLKLELASRVDENAERSTADALNADGKVRSRISVLAHQILDGKPSTRNRQPSLPDQNAKRMEGHRNPQT